MARFLEYHGDVEVFALTFDIFNRKYSLLNEELKSKYFQDEDKNHVKISHWSDFVSQFVENHEEILTLEQKNLLRKETSDYKIGGNAYGLDEQRQDFKSILIIIGKKETSSL